MLNFLDDRGINSNLVLIALVFILMTYGPSVFERFGLGDEHNLLLLAVVFFLFVGNDGLGSFAQA